MTAREPTPDQEKSEPTNARSVTFVDDLPSVQLEVHTPTATARLTSTENDAGAAAAEVWTLGNDDIVLEQRVHRAGNDKQASATAVITPDEARAIADGLLTLADEIDDE